MRRVFHSRRVFNAVRLSFMLLSLACSLCTLIHGVISEERLNRVMEEVELREKYLQQSELLLQRFKKATQRF